ncbi:protein phosphatase 2C domain-containing protein [Synechococcales cyanobacterium C]|uniref:Protein phosphatase 2C domain-containing protein n=1 Tax=Petrachloros mirabilis ULC683 TaxID=2781853 RepID=A0A8K2A6G3_9CYAN|nr:PP2C family serine/threonine-protein phosphatase [Petrachloros mirabilis]NCJ06049.1 protein phosphatase 2C domain-containing protein [Petrachloros mirabilis ULC683]
MVWKAVVESTIGTRHCQNQVPCQDYGAVRVLHPAVVGALSDGAGSAQHAEVGAQVAVEVFIQELTEQLPEWLSLQEADLASQAEAFFVEGIKTVVQSLETEAARLGCSVQDLHCTLLGFVSTPYWIAAMQIGDGFIVVRPEADASYELLFQPVKGEYINETVFVTSTEALSAMQVGVRAGQYPFICAATDGLEKVAIRLQGWLPHAPFFQPFQDCLSLYDAQQQQDYVQSFLSSEALNARTDDDKTLLACLYQPEEAPCES